MTESTIRYERDDDGIVTLTLDDPSSSANTMNPAYAASMRNVVDRLYAERDEVVGVVVTSAKKTFFAGGDLVRLMRATPADADAIFAEIEGIKADLRRLETLGRPVAAAINGAALGGGLEIALACHHRVAVDDGRSEIGLPEVTLGLLPGAGGVTRTVRMFGLQDALMNVLLQGQRNRPARAHKLGLIDELVTDAADVVPAARSWVLEHRDDEQAARQPWDREGYRIPGGTPSTPKLAQNLPAFPANLRKQLKGAAYPAPRAIMSAAVEGAQVDIDTALRIESRYFVDLVTGPIAKNMIQAFFFDLQAINGGVSRPRDFAPYKAQRAGILGAGMMGAGIAYSCARAGIDVVLKDTSIEAAERGKAHSASLLEAQVSKGRMTQDKAAEVLARISPTEKPADLAGCDLVIEAVFESQQLKHQVFGEIQEIVDPDALLCSNTSTLPITGLASAVSRPQDFIGLHFFSPVDKMPLVEIIVGEQTSDGALAKAYDVVRSIKKTPIVVNDSRGFFTSRVFGTLVLEGAAMLAEGVDPSTIERAATQMGFPAPPLAMIDEVSLILPQKIRDEAQRAAKAAGVAAPPEHPGMAVIDRMVAEFSRHGKAAGAGFYDYPEGAPKQLWPQLRTHFAATAEAGGTATFEDLQERFTFAMSLETIKCVAEGVLRSTADANIGSIFGIGFPALFGGALQYVNNYQRPVSGASQGQRPVSGASQGQRPVSGASQGQGAAAITGPAAFAARAEELTTYGDRFQPPPLLVEKAAAGERF